jgi:signal transduction histidine kinase/Tfp pilus assembly protein PilF
MNFRLAIFLYVASFAQGYVAFGAQQDSAQAALHALPLEERVEALQKIVVSLWLNYPDSAMTFALESEKLALSSKDKRMQSIATRMVGGVYYYKGEFNKALAKNMRAYELSVEVGDSTLISSGLNNIGLTYYELGEYPDALEHLLRSLFIKTKIKQMYGLGQTLNNIGLVHTKLKNLHKAREYFNEAQRVSIETNDKNILIYTINNLGFTYLYEEDFAKAEQYFLRALRMADEVDNDNRHATAFSGLAQVYLKTNRTEEARKLLMSSLALRTKIGEKAGISEVYSFLARICASQAKLDSAFYYLHISQGIARQIGARERKLSNYDLMKEFYTQKGRYDSALFFQSRYIELKDSLFNENMARKISDMELRINEEETLRSLAAKDIEIARKNLVTKFLIGLVLLIIFATVIVYRNLVVQSRLSRDLSRINAEVLAQAEEIRTQKEALVLSHHQLEQAQERIQKQNAELEALNIQLLATVDQRTKELEEANKELKNVNLELDNFIYKSSHDIKGPLVRLLGLCQVALLDIKEEKSLEYLHLLYDSAQQLNDIFDSLKKVSNINTMELESRRIEFNSLLSKVLGNLRRLPGFADISISQEIEKDMEFYSDPFLLETILHNMIENAVRFQKKSRQPDKFIALTICKTEENIVMSFVDNGIGIRENDIEHLFKMFSKAALEHQTVGLGLYIVKQCVEKLYGQIRLVNNKEGYTEFEITLPLNFREEAFVSPS